MAQSLLFARNTSVLSMLGVPSVLPVGSMIPVDTFPGALQVLLESGWGHVGIGCAD